MSATVLSFGKTVENFFMMKKINGGQDKLGFYRCNLLCCPLQFYLSAK
ncbi:MAG: hypothetical protein ACTTIT_03045 [Treponema sp.]